MGRSLLPMPHDLRDWPRRGPRPIWNQVGFEKLIPEATMERFGRADLPWRCDLMGAEVVLLRVLLNQRGGAWSMHMTVTRPMRVVAQWSPEISPSTASTPWPCSGWRLGLSGRGQRAERSGGKASGAARQRWHRPGHSLLGPGGDAWPGDVTSDRLHTGFASAFSKWVTGSLPPARDSPSPCGSPPSLQATADGGPRSGPSRCAQPHSRGDGPVVSLRTRKILSKNAQCFVEAQRSRASHSPRQSRRKASCYARCPAPAW